MLIFVIPLKSRKICQSWERTSRLLERTLRSVCNQTVSNFQVIVVCNEKPVLDFTHPHITYIEVDFPIPKESNPIAKGDTDKGRKILAGIDHAQKWQPTHFMSVDADDCVSNRLGELTQQYPQHNGWFINQGYKYIEGSSVLFLKKKEFYTMCGTAYLLKFSLLELPAVPEYDRGYGYYKFYLEHSRIKKRMAAQGYPLQALPFPGAVYVLGTGENQTDNDKKLFFNIFNRKKINKSIKKEFGVYPLKID